LLGKVGSVQNATWPRMLLLLTQPKAREKKKIGAHTALKKPPSLQLSSRIDRRNLRKSPQRFSTSFPATSGTRPASATTDVDLSLAVARATLELP
jgi:hypothetical protein